VSNFKHEALGNVRTSTVEDRPPGEYGHLVRRFNDFDEVATTDPVREGHGLGSPTSGHKLPINGPAFYFGRWIPVPVPHALNSALGYDEDRLPGIVLFWFFVGLSIERHRNKKAVDTHFPTRAAVLFTLAALCSGAVALGGFSYVFCPSPNLSCSEQVQDAGVVLTLALKYPLRTTATMVMSTAVWSLGFGLYFIRRAFAALRKTVDSQRHTSTA
jgi:hypothetical protein